MTELRRRRHGHESAQTSITNHVEFLSEVVRTPKLRDIYPERVTDERVSRIVATAYKQGQPAFVVSWVGLPGGDTLELESNVAKQDDFSRLHHDFLEARRRDDTVSPSDVVMLSSCSLTQT